MSPAILQPPAAPPAAITAEAPTALAFRKARLGMSLAAWRGSAPYRAAATCTPATAEARLVCRVADQPLGGGYQADGVASTFSGGRLVQVTFTTSIDAFAYVVAELKRSDGPPDRVDSDTATLADGVRLPRVRMLWRGASGTVRLTDPVRLGSQLAIRVVLDAAAPPPAAEPSPRPDALLTGWPPAQALAHSRNG